MAVKIRLKRMGTKKKPIYRLVVVDSSKPRNGSSLEEVGLYNPWIVPKEFRYEKERVVYWLGVGAQPTDVVRSFLSKDGIVEAKPRRSQNQGTSRKTLKQQAEKA